MESDYKIHPKTLPAKDYWGQVKRTVNGQPILDREIEVIVNAITRNLLLTNQGSDVLLDLGCGNGALSERIFNTLHAFFGVDYSEYLISVAKRDFEKAPDFCFEVGDVLDYVLAEKIPERFTKVLCYGCFSYFPDPEKLLAILSQRFINASHVFIGNLPDRERAELFYKNGLPGDEELTDFDSKIGVWRSQQEIREMAQKAGWEARFSFMPQGFFNSHYRYDVTLIRNS
ncbi:class I SAM-dependent methyltransferase [Paralcaligenes sp. KSB-10]|uniref:class I SAM-dependent methyltransferase n=1 Tax=Paralcaligenes sp. KSB-10 TaxID=2901142 RepID=UPI001E584AC0|nr:class I SAM-dependent methyltransferase [Paralcaligenes sp. KSB-10]UHL65281.1 class I SAM-dependent methyltransferase [Paralcaligenes sp. KSB-10]